MVMRKYDALTKTILLVPLCIIINTKNTLKTKTNGRSEKENALPKSANTTPTITRKRKYEKRMINLFLFIYMFN